MIRTQIIVGYVLSCVFWIAGIGAIIAAGFALSVGADWLFIVVPGFLGAIFLLLAAPLTIQQRDYARRLQSADSSQSPDEPPPSAGGSSGEDR